MIINQSLMQKKHRQAIVRFGFKNIAKSLQSISVLYNRGLFNIVWLVSYCILRQPIEQILTCQKG
jgi:hypothetical protein